MASRQWQTGSLNPAQLTGHIKHARTIQALFSTFSTNQKNFNHIHLSACWNSLGHLSRAAGPEWFKDHGKSLVSLIQHTSKVVSQEKVQARQLVNVAHALARCGRTPGAEALTKALATSIGECLANCNSQELANAAWAFAKLGHSDAHLFDTLARVAEKRVGDFNAQELANTAWAFATAGHLDVKLFVALAGVVEQGLDYFTSQGLANTAWAFAKAGHSDTKLFVALGKAAEWRLAEFNAQDLAHTAWAFAKAGHVDAQLFSAMARLSERCLANFNAQGLANTAWAFAKASHTDPQLFTALARSIERRIEDCNAQDIANTAWAFAKACHLDENLFGALARSAQMRLGDFNAQDLVNTAWAFSKLGHADETLFAALARSMKCRLDDFSAPQLANVAWAFAKAGQLDAKLFKALAKSAERHIRDFSAQDLANIAWAFANAGLIDESLFTAMAESVDRCVGDFNDEDLENTAWAFAKAGHHSVAKRLRHRNEGHSLPPLGSVDAISKCGRIVVAGGGIGGAAVAVALQSKGFDVVVLEGDASFDARKQGYGLTIQAVDAMQALGISLVDEDVPCSSHYIFSSEGHILGVYGEEFRQKKDRRVQPASAGRFLHVPRQTLRAKLVERVRPGTIRWSSKLKSFSCWSGADGPDSSRRGSKRRSQNNDIDVEGERRGVTVTLMDGTTIEADMLLGADGIFSTVRRKLAFPGDRLNCLGLIVVLGMVPTAASVNSDCAEGDGAKVVVSPLPLNRIFETVDGVTRIYVMPFTAEVTMWQLSFPYPEESALRLVKDPPALRAEILRRCADWHEPIPDLLGSTPLDSMAGWAVYDRDPLSPDLLQALRTGEGHKKNKPQWRVSLLGDSAHPLCPFRAQGANQALSDAVAFADILESSVRRHGPRTGMDMALPVFEQKMLSRSARMVLGSREKAKELHSNMAMQPARKVQRETGIDMRELIRVLRAKGIGAHTAVDPRGLDAVVADVIDKSGLMAGSPAHAATPQAEGTPQTKKQRKSDLKKEPELVDAADGSNKSPASKVVVQDAATNRHRVKVEVDADWWKQLMFDGYTGEHWVAWSTR